MAQSGYTPIQLYYSLTAASTPLVANLASGELAINATDGKLFYKDNANALQVIGWKTTPATAGGTGQTSYVIGDLLYASTTTAISRLAAGTSTYVLTSNGAGTAPSWQASSGGVASFQTSLSGLTPSTAATGVVTLAGTLGAGSGGTGQSTYAVGDTLYASAATPIISKLTIGTAYQINSVNSAGTLPSWQGLSSLLDNVFTASAQGTVLYRGASSWVALGVGTNGQFLTSGGAAANVSWTTGSGGGGVTTISFGTTGLTPNTATAGAVVVAGTLNAANGGTGLSTFAIGDIMYASAATPTISKLAIGTANQVMTVNTGATAPQWVAQSTLTAGKATNIAGGLAGTLFYNTALDTTTALSIGTAYQLLGVNAGGTAPSWQGLSSLLDNVFTASAQGTILYRGASTWAALAPGTATHVLTTGGAAANPSWAAAAAGLTGFTAALNVGAPNNTVNVSSLVASGGTTNQHAAIVPKGTASFMLAIPDSGTAGGATRGTYSVDLQLSRSSVAAVAGGDYGGILAGNNNTITSGTAGAIIAGTNNVLLASYSNILGGDANTMNNSAGTAVLSSFIIGGVGSFVNRSYSTMINGRYGTNRAIYGSLTIPSSYNYGGSTLGAQQAMQIQIGVETTNATATRITTDGNAADTRNIITLNNNGAAYFKGRVIANVTGAGNSKVWNFEGGLKRGATAATTVLIGSVAINIVAADAGASTWVIAVTADNTNGGLNVTVTGQAATTIRWNCQVDTVEMSF